MSHRERGPRCTVCKEGRMRTTGTVQGAGQVLKRFRTLQCSHCGRVITTTESQDTPFVGREGSSRG